MTNNTDENTAAAPQHTGGITFHNEEEPPTRALIVHIVMSGPDGLTGNKSRSIEAERAEIIGLAQAIDLDIIDVETVGLKKITPATYIGSGKTGDIGKLVKKNDIELVITNTQLSPGQQRNLERRWHCKVVDRTGLILEIFGRRAQTREGRLQVELAHLAYQRSRLVHSWTHLERQRGGGGFVGGPGETQKESDRRDLQFRIKVLEKQLVKVKKTRSLHRKSRQKVPYSVVALVGYTNAGKSTLFNKLTTGDVLAKDLLFATLDPTMRKLTLPHGRTVILSDTVGFISNLPTQLIAAFRATLEEVLSADLIVHVRDISHEDTEVQSTDVHNVLGELGVPQEKLDDMLEVWNKADLLEGAEKVQRSNQAKNSPDTVLMSALTGEGGDEFLEAVELKLAADDNILDIQLGSERGADIAWLYQNGDVLERTDSEKGDVSRLTVRFANSRIGVARQKFSQDLFKSAAA